MTAIKWPKLFPTPQTTIFFYVWNLWRLETGTQSKDLNLLWNFWGGRPSLSLPKQRGGRVKWEQEQQGCLLGWHLVMLVLRSGSCTCPWYFSTEGTDIYSTPTHDHMLFTYVTHLMLIPSYPGPQGSEKLWPCSTGAQSSHIHDVKTSNTKLMQINSSSLLAFIKYSEGSM